VSNVARYGLRTLVATAILFTFALYLGCGSKEKTETPAAQEKTTQSPQTTGDTQAQTPQTPTETVDWTAYDNPKPGICPVCGMKLHPDYMEVTLIGEKKYACCSSHCASMLAANPDKYLTAGASPGESH
jgi:YHS domain-containing protein